MNSQNPINNDAPNSIPPATSKSGRHPLAGFGRLRVKDIPPLPTSLNIWLLKLGEIFFQKHGRCIAAALIIDSSTRDWTRPLIPSQNCATDGVTFRAEPADFVTMLPHHRVGGSFQTVADANPENLLARIPQFNGLHILSLIGGAKQHQYWFMRIGVQLQSIPAEKILRDDWSDAINQHMPKLVIR